MNSSPEKAAVSNAKGPEGSSLLFIISASGTGPDGDNFVASPGGATPGPNQRNADPDGDFEGFGESATIYGSGSFTLVVKTLDDERDLTYGDYDAVFGVLVSNANANNLVTATSIGTIVEGGGRAPQCICSCTCGNVEAGNPSQPVTDGGPTANTSQGAQPNDLYYRGLTEPHPIATVNDTLSSTIGQASDVMVQTTLDDLSDNVLYTAAPVYYNASGYTQGQAVQFSQQLNVSGLSDGTYQSTTTVTEEYPGSLPVQRSYTNFVPIQNLDNSPYGSGWTLKNVDRLVTQSLGVSIEDGSGSVSYFAIDNTGQYDAPDNRTDVQSLVQNADGTYTLVFRDQRQELFTSGGLLSSALDKNGNQSAYQWNGNGTLASVTDQAGRTTTFAYSNGMLASVTDFAGRVTSYGDTNRQLTSITSPAPGDGEQQHVTTMGYDPSTGMLTTITDAGGTTTLAYNSFRQVTSITAPDNTTTQYAAPSSMSLVDTSSGVGTQSNPAPLVYTANVEGSVTDGNGHTSHYTVDPFTSQTLSTTDATADNTTTYAHNAASQVTQIVQPPLTPGGQNLVTTLGYDANGNLDQETFPDGTSESWTFDPTWNEPTKYINPAGRETDYSLDPSNGNVLTVTQVGSNGDANRVTTYTYTPNPTAQGQTPGGLVASMTDPRGIETEYF